MNFSTIFIISIFLLIFVFSGLAVKILFKKDGKFAGTCASQNPLLNKDGEECGICGAMPDEKCNKEI